MSDDYAGPGVPSFGPTPPYPRQAAHRDPIVELCHRADDAAAWLEDKRFDRGNDLAHAERLRSATLDVAGRLKAAEPGAAQDVRDAARWLTSGLADRIVLEETLEHVYRSPTWYSADAQAKLAAHAARLRTVAAWLDSLGRLTGQEEPKTRSVAPRVHVGKDTDDEAKPRPDDVNGVLIIPPELRLKTELELRVEALERTTERHAEWHRR